MSAFHQRHCAWRSALLFASAVAICTGYPCRLLAQEHEHQDADHDHDARLHFSHPLFTESPSPDTKVRVDYLFREIKSDTHEHSMRLEGE